MSRNKLLSQLAHVEIATPCPEDSAKFYVDVMGMTEVARDGSSIYLKCWGEWFHNSVILTEANEAGIIHIGWRAEGEEELQEAAKRLEAAGNGLGWIDGATGHGPAYRFRPPGGQNMEVFWEVERYKAPPELASISPGRPQKFPGRGANVRQLDHATMPTADVRQDAQWWQDNLGSRFMEYQVLDHEPDNMIFAMLSTNEQAHDLALLGDKNKGSGRVHHIAFWVDQVHDLQRGVDVLWENGTPIEYGPGRHGQGENSYLYFREPGGMRIEMYSGGYRNYQPDWEPIRWGTPSQGAHDISRSAIPDHFLDVFPLSGMGGLKVDDAGLNPWVLEGVQ
jgi:catechol 2,3-dioxygenase